MTPLGSPPCNAQGVVQVEDLDLACDVKLLLLSSNAKIQLTLLDAQLQKPAGDGSRNLISIGRSNSGFVIRRVPAV